MNRYSTEGIILARTNYGEADRILTFLTPDHGKVQAIAKGVRRQKSKLAGGLELFSVSHLTLLVGKSEINTLISTKLKKHYSHIPTSLERTDAAYEMIKSVAKSTADHPEAAYFELLESGFEALDSPELDYRLSKLWFGLHLLKLTGHSPNLRTDSKGSKLERGVSYDFDSEAMCFVPVKKGHYSTNHIKLLRLAEGAAVATVLTKLGGYEGLIEQDAQHIQLLSQKYLLHR